MNQATKTQIENEAEEYAISLGLRDLEEVSKEDQEKFAKHDFTEGATKHAELLEQEKATTEMLRKSLAHETTQRIFDNEKGKKLVEALELINKITYGCSYNSETLQNIIEKALTEYKK